METKTGNTWWRATRTIGRRDTKLPTLIDAKFESIGIRWLRYFVKPSDNDLFAIACVILCVRFFVRRCGWHTDAVCSNFNSASVAASNGSCCRFHLQQPHMSTADKARAPLIQTLLGIQLFMYYRGFWWFRLFPFYYSHTPYCGNGTREKCCAVCGAASSVSSRPYGIHPLDSLLFCGGCNSMYGA